MIGIDPNALYLGPSTLKSEPHGRHGNRGRQAEKVTWSVSPGHWLLFLTHPPQPEDTRPQKQGP